MLGTTVTTQFTQFLQRHNAVIGTVRAGQFDARSFFPEDPRIPLLTRFAAVHDTYLYAQTLKVMASMLNGRKLTRLIDLGAGSCVPTLVALHDRPNFVQNVIAVDSDKHALQIASRNIDLFQPSALYTFVESDMLSYLVSNPSLEGAAIIANPPYLPIPESLKDEEYYLPVNGGTDGLKFLAPILTSEMPRETLLAIEWCSLSSPAAMIDFIEDKYDVLYVQAYEISAGVYTEDEKLKPYYLELFEQGKVVIKVNDDGTIGWYFVGVVLRRK